ncbi:MAG: DUF3488 domain-containing protein, partial [Phycisphaerales bacterium]
MNPRLLLRCTLACALLATFCYAAADNKPLLALAALAAAIGSAFMSRAGLLRTLPRFAINLMVLAATGNVFLQVISVRSADNSVISDLTDFLVFILLIKMFDRGRARDEAQLVGLSMFVVIGAVLTSNSLLTGAFLILFTPLCIITVVLYQLYAGVQRTVERAHAGQPGPVPLSTVLMATPRARRDFVATTAFALLASLFLGVVGFIFTPRTLTEHGGSWGLRRGAETGFRDNITLGQAGGISISTEPVMDVVLSDESGRLIADRAEPLYLRGAVLDEYDSARGTWRARAKHDRYNQTLPSDTVEKDKPFALMGATPGRQRIIQHVSIRRARAERHVTLFSLWRPLSIAFDDTGTLYHSNGDDVVLQRLGPGERVGYTVVSAPDSVEDFPSPPLARFDSPRIRDRTAGLRRAAQLPPHDPSRDPA